MIGFEYCAKHLKQICNLEINKSKMLNIGVGLFAKQNVNKNRIVFKKGQMILKYNGELLNENEYQTRYKDIKADGPYAIFLNNSHTIDSACWRGTASLINHKRKKDGANAEFVKKSNGVFVLAFKDVYEGEELFADYGAGYVFEKNFKTIDQKNLIIY